MKKNEVKNTFFFFLLLMTNSLRAQDLKFGFSVGSGFFAIEENADKHLNMSFSAPLSYNTSISLMDQSGKSFGVKMQYADCRVKGNNWLTNEEIDGLVSLSSYFGYFEKYWLGEKVSNLFLIGLGLTNENYLMKIEQHPKIRNYVSLMFGWGINYPITDRLNLRMEATPFVTDVFNGLRYMLSDWKGQSVGEDIHVFINIGIDYKLNLK